MSVFRGLDWYVVDEFGDVWNEVALTTFDQAYSYRGLIAPLINRITTLSITFRGRDHEYTDSSKIRPKAKESTYELGADF